MVVGLLALLAAAAALVVGSRQQRLPAPFGPAANGVVVFSTADGDIVSADPETGEVTTIVAGDDSGFDSAPWFANDGTKFAFDRQAVPNAVPRILTVADADGTNVREISEPLSPIRWFDWSPMGDRMVVLREGDPLGVVTLVDAETGTPTRFSVGFQVNAASFRPGTDELILSWSRRGLCGQRRRYRPAQARRGSGVARPVLDLSGRLPAGVRDMGR